jgi:hypothetical protein
MNITYESDVVDMDFSVPSCHWQCQPVVTGHARNWRLPPHNGNFYPVNFYPLKIPIVNEYRLLSK